MYCCHHHKNMSLSTLPKAFKLSNGQMIPALGFGTYKAEPGQVKRVVADAIRIGYTHLDCAWAYSNQDEVGEVNLLHLKITLPEADERGIGDQRI